MLSHSPITLTDAGSATYSAPRFETIQDWLDHQARQQLLRFITCGSVDDGKSTLIGRLLYETKMVLSDQLETLASDYQYSDASAIL